MYFILYYIFYVLKHPFQTLFTYTYIFLAYIKFLFGHLGIFLTSSQRRISHYTWGEISRQRRGVTRVRSLSRSSSREIVCMCVFVMVSHTPKVPRWRRSRSFEQGYTPFSLAAAVRSLDQKPFEYRAYFRWYREKMKKYSIALLHIKYALFSLIWIRARALNPIIAYTSALTEIFFEA